MPVGGMNASGGAIWNAGNAPYVLRCVLDEFAEEPQQVARVVEFVEEDPDVDVVDRMQLELERGHDAEVAAAAAERPEQVRVLVLAGVHWTWPSAVTTSAESRLSIDSP